MHRNQQVQGWNSLAFSKFLNAVHVKCYDNIQALPGILDAHMKYIRAHIEKNATEKEREALKKAEDEAKALDGKAMEEDDSVSLDGYGKYLGGFVLNW